MARPAAAATARALRSSSSHRAARPTKSTDDRRATADAGGEKVVGDEPAHRRADAPLVFRHDCGMGDRQPEGVAKKRDDGEPVGAGADHAGFGEGAEIGRSGPVRRRAAQGEIDRCHQDGRSVAIVRIRCNSARRSA